MTKHRETPTPDGDRPAFEVEVTEEMIEAGMEYFRLRFFDEFEQNDPARMREFVVGIYSAIASQGLKARGAL